MSSRGSIYVTPGTRNMNHYLSRDLSSRDKHYSSISNRFHDNGYSEPPVDYDDQYITKKIRFKDEVHEDDYESDASIESHESLNTIWGRFADRTAMHGCGYIYHSKMWYAKAIWIFLFLGAIGGMIYHLLFLTTNFTVFPKQTKITLSFSNLPFPAITICNSNLVRLSMLNESDSDLHELIVAADALFPKHLVPKTEEPPSAAAERVKRFIDEFNDTGVDDFSDYYDYYSYVGDGLPPPPKDTYSVLEESFQKAYLNVERNKRIRIGHQLEDMLISCSYGGYKCHYKNFTRLADRDFGNCYTLELPRFRATQSGPQHGVTMILYLGKEDYVVGACQGLGIRLVVHELMSYPFPADHGIYLPPAYESHIGLKLSNIYRIGQPHGKCNDGLEYKKQYGVTYTRKICQALCSQSEMYRRCGCYNDWNEDMLHFLKKKDLRGKMCNSDTEKKCKKEILRLSERKQLSCSCEDPCFERKYMLYPSYRVWPNDDYLPVMQQGACENLSPDICNYVITVTDHRKISQNFLKFTIYYEDLNFEELREKPEIETTEFMSDVGGAIGLWIGLSLLAVFEVLQFLGELTMYLCRRHCPKQKQGREEENKKPRGNGSMYSKPPARVPMNMDRNGNLVRLDCSQQTSQSRWPYGY